MWRKTIVWAMKNVVVGESGSDLCLACPIYTRCNETIASYTIIIIMFTSESKFSGNSSSETKLLQH